MDNTLDTITISNEPLDASLDFQFLRQEGIRHIQKLAGKIWTDHNLHDPGITILDQLCYAITDLSYRLNFDIKDLIAEEDETGYKSLYSPAQILTVNPVTLLDIRKVVVDVEGVKNAWVEKVVRPDPEVFYDSKAKSLTLSDAQGNADRLNISGLFKVMVEKNEAAALNSDILPDVKARLHAVRNLCEDFAEIRILDPQRITISGRIEVGQIEDINVFAAMVIYRLAAFISPTIRFYTLEELLKKDKRIDEIFDGPALQHGFIDDEELGKLNRRTELHTSDIIREIMDEQEVLSVNQIALAIGLEPKQNWRLILDKQQTPALDRGKTLEGLQFVKNDSRLTVDTVKVERIFIEMSNADLYFPLPGDKRDIKTKPGKFRNVEQYHSIQNHFPEAFGIGEIGLPASASSKRTAQAKQLRAYLLFFEQILANYFSQVAHVKDLFSFYTEDVKMYYCQSLAKEVPGVSDVLNNMEEYEANLAAIIEDEKSAFERKNEFLNHLLARFSESLTDYSLWLHDQSLSFTKTAKQDKPKSEQETLKKVIEDKLFFLRNYPLISNDRGKAFNYKLKSWGTENISGLEKRIAAKLGISNFKRKSLSNTDEEGFHMLEHILLRPVAEDYLAHSQYLVPQLITLFERRSTGRTKCTSKSHGLQNGERIEIRGSEGYDGTYSVGQVVTDSFEIEIKFVGSGIDRVNNDKTVRLTPTWVRTEVDTRILLLTRPITDFSPVDGDANKTACRAISHGLAENESLEILGTTNYNGIYKVFNNTESTFVINKPFKGNETGGRWINPVQRKDPYSLQLTFVFPDFVGADPVSHRFKNDNFRAFIENTIREETPAHLTVYIRWLAKDEMLKFEDSFHTFLEQLRNK